MTRPKSREVESWKIQRYPVTSLPTWRTDRFFPLFHMDHEVDKGAMSLKIGNGVEIEQKKPKCTSMVFLLHHSSLVLIIQLLGIAIMTMDWVGWIKPEDSLVPAGLNRERFGYDGWRGLE